LNWATPRARSISKRSLADDRRQANFLRGEPGEPGRNGLDGIPGLDGAPGLDGIPGIDGRNGKDGRDGKDGKDGLPGERGPIGPPGPAGEPGKRGKIGPPGKVGSTGQPGVCVYQAKFNCSRETDLQKVNDSSVGNAVLLAPTMIGLQTEIDGEQSVMVREGDNVYLSCEAFGQPQPSYSWQRWGKSPILLDLTSSFKVSSFPGGQLPLINVGRMQAGKYQCIASNGISPPATKTVNLDVTFAPIIRLFPGPSIYIVKLGSSIAFECIVEASPSAFIYWMFGSNSIMAKKSTQLSKEVTKLTDSSRHRQYIVTESIGQLSTGAHYSILTLNLTNIAREDLGLYKCVGKNLIGQSEGYVWVEDDSTVEQKGRKFRDLILEQTGLGGQLDPSAGWPSYMLERYANYSTFGIEFKQTSFNNNSLSKLKVHIKTLESMLNSTRHIENPQQGSRVQIPEIGSQIKSQDILAKDDDDKGELCRILRDERLGYKLDRSRIMLLDQVGKPVYLGSVSDGTINWWSLGDATDDEAESSGSVCFVTFSNVTDRLFRYNSLSDLVRNQYSANSTRASQFYELKYPIYGSSHLIHERLFVYVGLVASSLQDTGHLSLVLFNLNTGHSDETSLEDVLLKDIIGQPADSGVVSKLERVELASDENGVWLIILTSETSKRKIEDSQGLLASMARRIHLLKLELLDGGANNISIEHHVDMKLDWGMVGQLFIIDGVLYGTKDKHSYTSKLQFAYDLYKCRLLPKEYLNESHRTLTNHFGSTQMIRYNPDEPKRLLIIDGNNLLWCPVKLMEREHDDDSQQAVLGFGYDNQTKLLNP